MDAFWTSLSNMIGGQSLLHATTSSDLSVLSTLSQHHRLVLAVGRYADRIGRDMHSGLTYPKRRSQDVQTYK